MYTAPVVGSTHVRPFAAEHIPDVADLHTRVFRTGAPSSAELMEEYRRYLCDVFLKPSTQSDGVGPLVYVDGTKVRGFLGVTPRPMLYNGERVQACVTSQFIVDPLSRGRAGIELLRAFFNGPQTLSIADESNAGSRRIWEALGGSTSLVHSMQWICPIRPSRFALWAAGRGERFAAALSQLIRPAAGLMDFVASRNGANPFQVMKPQHAGEDLDRDAYAACIRNFAAKLPLHPNYDSRLLNWLIDRAEGLSRQGSLHKVLVRSERGEVMGWYIYYANPQGFSEVLQTFALAGKIGAVLDHLLHHGYQRGAIALRGRCEPALADVLSERHWPCGWGPWMLVHSKRADVLRAFQRGDVFFSRLDGEWCTHLR